MSIRLKSLANTFRVWKGSETALPSILGRYAGGKNRSFGTSFGFSMRELVVGSFQEEIVSALCSGERKKASNLLSELGRVSQTLQAGDFICILQHCARAPDPSFVMETWKFMEEKDIELSYKCYFLTIRALCKGGYLKEAFEILHFQRKNSEICPTLPIYNNLLAACIQMHRLDLARECLNLMEEQGVGKSLVTFGYLLRLAVMQKDLSAAHQIWKECINLQSPSIIILQRFIWSFSVLRDLESAYMALQLLVALALQHKCKIKENVEGTLFDLKLDIPIPSLCDLSSNRNGRNSLVCQPCDSDHYCVKDSGMGDKLGMAVCLRDGADGLNLSKQLSSEPVMKLLRWSFHAVIHGCANSQNPMLANQLMLQMQNLGLELSPGIYDGLIKSLVSVKNFWDGIEVLKVMQQKHLKPLDSSLAVLSVCCSQSLELDLAENFLHRISHCPHAYTFNVFLQACVILDQPERAVRALAKMRHMNVLPNVRTYELMFSLFGTVNAPYEDGDVLSSAVAIKRITYIEKYMMRHDIQHSAQSMQNLLGALGKEGRTKDMIQYLHVAENQFLDRNIDLGIHVYNTVLHALVKAKENDLAVKIFKSIISSGQSTNRRTYGVMFHCCRGMKCYRSACALVSMKIRRGFLPDVRTYTSLTKVLLHIKDFHEALRLLDKACSEGIQTDTVFYNTILQFACGEGRIDVIELILGQMHQMKIQPDPTTCTHVFLAYAANGYDSTAMEALQVLCMRMISDQEDILKKCRLEYEGLLYQDNMEAESQIIEVFKDSEYICVALLCLRWCAILGYPISWFPSQSPWARTISNNYASKHHR